MRATLSPPLSGDMVPDASGAARFDLGFALKAALIVAVLRSLLTVTNLVMSHTLDLYGDPDSNVRLQQVRDLLAGQGWFDLTLHNFGLNAGTAMHWSRLADIGPAALLFILSLFLPQSLAEQVTLFIYPQLLFIPLFVVLLWATRRLAPEHSQRAISIALGFVIVQFSSLMAVFGPGNIDHHSLQIIALIVVLGAMAGQRTFRSGVICALGLVAGLVIGLDGVPAVLAAGAAIVILWLINPVREAAFMKGLGLCIMIATPVAALIFMPRPWSDQWCDSWTLPLGQILFGGGALAFALGWASKALEQRLMWRLLAATLGCCVMGALVLLHPACLSPLGLTDRLIGRFWMENITDNLPIWNVVQIDPALLVSYWSAPIMLVSYGIAMRRQTQVLSKSGPVLAALTMAWVFTCLYWRGGPVMAAICAMVTCALLLNLRARAKGPLARVGAIALCAPILPSIFLGQFIGPMLGQQKPIAKASAPGQPNGRVSHCLGAAQLAQIQALPKGTMISPFVMTEYLLPQTHHRVAFGGYHRAYKDNLTIIRLLTASPDIARQALQTNGVTYINVCNETGQLELMADAYPGSLVARLLQKAPPDWLTPIIALEQGGVTYKVNQPARP